MEDKCQKQEMESPKRFEQALQWRQGSWQRSICAVRPKGVRYLFPHTMLIDAVPVGNGSACSFRMSLSKFIFDLHLSSTFWKFHIDIMGVNNLKYMSRLEKSFIYNRRKNKNQNLKNR